MLYVLDGTAACFRAWFSVPPTMAPDGTEVGALSGLASWIARVLRRFHPTYIAIVFDAGTWTFRNEIWPDYKANRGEPPEELVPQLALAPDLVREMGCPAFSLDGHEADDLIATLARRAVQAGLDARLLTPDKDVMQLIDDHVRVVDPKDLEERGPDYVQDKFGVTPAQLGDFLALAGDPTDNIPGIRGIGAKTAQALITALGSLDALLEDPDRAAEVDVRGARTLPDRIREGLDDVRISQRLVKLDEEAPLEPPVSRLGDLRWRPPAAAAEAVLFARLGLRMPPLG